MCPCRRWMQTRPTGAGSNAGLELMPIDTVTLSDGRGPGERDPRADPATSHTESVVLRVLRCHDRFSYMTIRYRHVRGDGSGRAVRLADGLSRVRGSEAIRGAAGHPWSHGSWLERSRGPAFTWPSLSPSARNGDRSLAAGTGRISEGAGICGAGASDDVPGCVAPGRCLAVRRFPARALAARRARDCGAWPAAPARQDGM